MHPLFEISKALLQDTAKTGLLSSFGDVSIPFDELEVALGDEKLLTGLASAISGRPEGIFEKICRKINCEYDQMLLLCYEKYGTLYIPGLRNRAQSNSVLEYISTINYPQDPWGWVPVDVIGPGLIVGHMCPNYPKPEIPTPLIEYVLLEPADYITLRAGWVKQSIQALRKDKNHNYKLDKAKYCKALSNYTVRELLVLWRDVCSLYNQRIDFVLNSNPPELDKPLTAELIRLLLIGKIDADFDVWCTAKSSEIQDERLAEHDFHFTIDTLGVFDPNSMIVTSREMDFLKDHRPICEANKFLPMYVGSHILLIATPMASNTEIRAIGNEMAGQLSPPLRVIYIAISAQNYLQIDIQRKNKLKGDLTIELINQGDYAIAKELAKAVDDEDDDKVVKFVSLVISEGIRMGASDIHFEEVGGKFRVRYRVDGILMAADLGLQALELPLGLMPFVTRRIKTMAKMDTTKVRIPLDGRIRVNYKEDKDNMRAVDLRIATSPIESGDESFPLEKTVIRILDNDESPEKLADIMLDQGQLGLIKRKLAEPQGIVVVTGPTGSGKSTTLYAALQELNTVDVNIMTAENPVERKLPGINQTPIEPPNTFADQLKAMLRMDPDIILVGEIRDVETASLAIKAAQTGHLVLTTLHTNTAIASIPRLDQLNVKRFDAATSLNLLTAQRLVRALCPECKIERPLRKEELEIFTSVGIDSDLISRGHICVNRGCNHCNGAGYKGRLSVMELLDVDEEVRTRLTAADTISSLGPFRTYMYERGFRNMFYYGLKLVATGKTSLHELTLNVPDAYI